MKKLPYEDLDEIIFELSENADKNYHKLVDGPLDNKTFIINVVIGACMLFVAPIIALVICYLISR